MMLRDCFLFALLVITCVTTAPGVTNDRRAVDVTSPEVEKAVAWVIALMGGGWELVEITGAQVRKIETIDGLTGRTYLLDVVAKTPYAIEPVPCYFVVNETKKKSQTNIHDYHAVDYRCQL